MLDAVYGVVFTHLSIGDMSRVAATCHALRETIDADHELWAGVHARIGLRPTTRKGCPRTKQVLIQRIVSSCRCRQCGKSTRSRAIRPCGSSTPLCGTCTSTGYARLITRRDVHAILEQRTRESKFRPKKRRLPWLVFPHLTIAKFTWRGGHLFWPSELQAHLCRIGIYQA